MKLRPSDSEPLRSPRRLRGWKRFLPLATTPNPSGCQLTVLWRELAFRVTLTLLLLWCGLGFSAWGFARYRGIADAHLSDVMVPSRWKNFHRAIGHHWIAQAESLLASSETQSAVFHLRRGLAKAPDHLPGRRLLAALYAHNGAIPLAQQVLIDGLPHAHDDNDYLAATFAFLLHQQEDELVQSAAHALLTAPHLPPASAAVAVNAAATSAYHRGNFARAEELLQQHSLATTHDGRLLRARIEWDRGYRELALAQLRALAADFPSSEVTRTQLRQLLKAAGEHEDLRRLALLETIARPHDPSAQIELLRALLVSAPDDLPREIDAFFAEFSQSDTALLALANLAVEAADPALARRVHDHCVTHNLPSSAPACLEVEALIAAGEHRRALDRIQEFRESRRNDFPAYRALFNSLQAVAFYGLGDLASADLFLRSFLDQPGLGSQNLLAVAERFLVLGGQAQAHAVLSRAVATDPLNHTALTHLIELDLALQDDESLLRHLPRYLSTRRPSPTVLRAAYLHLINANENPPVVGDNILLSLQQALAASSEATLSPAGE